ncbi:component of SufBCD complex [Roseinatronobacter ekhonensis]|nr:component of SufBCD complex [Roseibaca ekhonensis]
MALLDNIRDLIDMRSFSSVWFWIVLALAWSSASQTIMGAPYDLIVKARRKGGEAAEDLNTIVGIFVRRRLTVVRRAGHWVLGFQVMVLTAVCIMAFGQAIEFAQALFLLFLPLVLTQFLAVRLAFRIEHDNMRDDRLQRALLRHRLLVQLIGVVAIFVTAVWGMLHVMSATVLSL